MGAGGLQVVQADRAGGALGGFGLLDVSRLADVPGVRIVDGALSVDAEAVPLVPRVERPEVDHSQEEDRRQKPCPDTPFHRHEQDGSTDLETAPQLEECPLQRSAVSAFVTVDSA
jgi:hypothetical protein